MTIREFARTIGVSPATVSRAIHGRGRINPATQTMVLERMKELEKLTRERVKDGVKNFRPQENSAAEFARTEAEIWLKAEEEKK